MGQDMVNLDICSMSTGKEYVFCCCQVEFSMNVDQILLIDGVVELYMLTDFLSSSIIFREKSVEVSSYNSGFVLFFFSFISFYFTYFTAASFGAYRFLIASLLGGGWTLHNILFPCSSLLYLVIVLPCLLYFN